MPSMRSACLVLLLAACAAAEVDLSGGTDNTDVAHRNLLAPKKKSPSPSKSSKKKSPSPKKSPKKKSPSPKKSPKKKSPSPKKSPKRSPSPKKSPRKSPPKNGGSSGGSSGCSDAPKVVKVGADGLSVFDPATVTVKSGCKVKFVLESLNHNVKFASCPLPKPDCDAMEKWLALLDLPAPLERTVTFGKKGTYDYVCTPHAAFGMVGKVVVT